MKDIAADSFLSLLESNDIKYEKEGNLFHFLLENNGKKIGVYYRRPGSFFIDKSDYIGQPHVISHWNPRNEQGEAESSKYGLCLAMNGSDIRDNALSLIGTIKRVRQIIFELWPDPISERFREINTSFKTRNKNDIYIDKDGKIRDKDNDGLMGGITFISIDYKGETREDICKEYSLAFNWSLISFKYKGQVKRVLLNGGTFYKLNDFTGESFWSRNGVKMNSKKIVIVGAGSIGGLVLDFFCRSGYTDITIYDNDEMDVVNNSRHVLGIGSNDIAVSKVENLKQHYSKLFPMIKISAFHKKFGYIAKDIENDSIVINTTGGSHKELFLNCLSMFESADEVGKNFIFIDVFVEPFGLGVHGIVFNQKETEMIDEILRHCLYKSQDRYIVTLEKDFRRNFDGCFTPTIEYGFTPLQIGVPMLLVKMIKDKFTTNHYTVPFLSLVPHKKEQLNKKMSKEINPFRIGVKKWKK